MSAKGRSKRLDSKGAESYMLRTAHRESHISGPQIDIETTKTKGRTGIAEIAILVRLF